MKKILVFGYFGYVTNQLDGQTIKTRAIYELLKEHSDAKVVFADSQQFHKTLLSIIVFFKNMASCDHLVWLPAHNNLKYLFPFIWFASLIFRFDIVYVVIGGWLSVFLESLPFHRSRLKHIKAILVENRLTVKELKEKYGFENLTVIPNFREDSPKPKFRVNDGILKVVFMARINMKKGLDTIAELCENVKESMTIDFYGPIHEEDREFFFNELVNKYSFVKYNGELQPSQIVQTLVNYDVLILPTHYYTEGFPGSILDAYRAGLPVIVTEWKYASEFVEDGITGFIADFNDPVSKIVNSIQYFISSPEALNKFKENAYKESLKYTSTSAWNVLVRYIN